MQLFHFKFSVMFSSSIPLILLMIGAGLALAFIVVQSLVSRRKLAVVPSLQPPITGASKQNASTPVTNDFITRAIEPVNEYELFLSDDVDFHPEWEIVEDERTVLLKEAENVVEHVQDIVSHVASNPPNEQEVVSKLNGLLNKYGLFEQTEYYDAINRFVLITVQRDLGITLDQSTVESLWLSAN